MEIRRFVSDLLQSNMYLIVENGHAIVVDPCRNTAPAEGLTVDRILLTHEHYDHISGVNAWKARFGAPVLCSAACGANIESPRKSLARFFDAFCELQSWMKLDRLPEADPDYRCSADEIFSDRLELQWQGHTLTLWELPGHSKGSTSIMIDQTDFFSGDSMMQDYPAELRFPGGSEKLWAQISEPRLAALPDGIRIWPGHFDSFLPEQIRKDG